MAYDVRRHEHGINQISDYPSSYLLINQIETELDNYNDVLDSMASNNFRLRKETSRHSQIRVFFSCVHLHLIYLFKSIRASLAYTMPSKPSIQCRISLLQPITMNLRLCVATVSKNMLLQFNHKNVDASFYCHIYVQLKSVALVDSKQTTRNIWSGNFFHRRCCWRVFFFSLLQSWSDSHTYRKSRINYKLQIRQFN